MSRESLTAEPRDASGKSPVARRLRKTGLVPGVIYGASEPVSFAVDILAASAALRHGASLIDVDIEGKKYITILKDRQVHPVRGHLMHLDLQEVSLKQKIRFTVPITVTGESPGVKTGGLLTQSIHEIEIETTPDNIPDSLVADVTGLEVGDTLPLSSLQAPDGAEVVGDPELTVISIGASRATRAANQAAARGEAPPIEDQEPGDAEAAAAPDADA
jgi:large subunit ribosomal protein L25